MGYIIWNHFRYARSWGIGAMPWIAMAIRIMHRQKCGNRLPWPMTTPYTDEIDERKPENDRGLSKVIGGFDWRLDYYWQILD